MVRESPEENYHQRQKKLQGLGGAKGGGGKMCLIDSRFVL